MRGRTKIERAAFEAIHSDTIDSLLLEVLLDIRELLTPPSVRQAQEQGFTFTGPPPHYPLMGDDEPPPPEAIYITGEDENDA
jgi:hypothetical protein